MKVTKEKVAEHRAAIVKSASKLFRAQGVEGVGVAEITSTVGLTHGGFYRHFDSKEALLGEACRQAFEDVTAIKSAVMSKPGGAQRMRNGYLNNSRVSGDADCPIATLGAEIARHGGEVQSSFAQGLRQFLGTSGHEVESPRWKRDTAEMAMLIGTLVMARAVRKADKPLADALISAALDSPL